MLYSVRNGADTALMRAINHTLNVTRTEASREIRKQIRLKAAYTRKRLTIQKATRSSLTGRISAPQRGRLLSRFSTLASVANSPASGLSSPPQKTPSVKVKPGRGTKKMPGAFFIGPLSNSGVIAIARRTQWGPGLGRSEGVKILYGPSLSQVFTDVAEELREPSSERVSQRLELEARNLLERAK